MKRLAGILLFSGAMLAPIAGFAEEAHRYYDRDGRDWHEWNEHENRAYRHWLREERHERWRAYNRLPAREQRAYWHWRHEHADWH